MILHRIKEIQIPGSHQSIFLTLLDLLISTHARKALDLLILLKSILKTTGGGDGLIEEWNGRVWLNPPYGNFTKTWLDKLRKHGNGIALVFTAFETTWGQDHAKTADGIYLLKGRVSFIDSYGKKSNNAGKGSCLIVYGKQNLESLKNIPGVLK